MTAAKMQKVFDKYNMRCAYCGYKIFIDADNGNPFKATIDHVVPQAEGGTDIIGNLFPSCFACNHAKDDMNLNEFRNALLTGKASKEGKDKEIVNVKSRYMIPYGKYVGIASYIWGGKFYFEKSKTEQENTRNIIDKVQEIYLSGTQTNVIDDFFKKPDENKKKAKKIIIVSNPQAAGAPANKKKAVKKTAVEKPAQLPKSSISKSERKIVYEKFGWRCAFCGCAIKGDTHTEGHSNACISKLLINGGNNDTNIVASCQDCQSAKLTFDLEEFRKRLFKDKKPKYGLMKTSKMEQLYDTHYTAFPSDRFFFEDPSIHNTVLAYWDTIPVTDLAGRAIKNNAIPAINNNAIPVSIIFDKGHGRSSLLPHTEESAEEPEYHEITDYSDMAAPLVQEYNNLVEIHAQLMEDLNDINKKIQKLKTAIDAINTL